MSDQQEQSSFDSSEDYDYEPPAERIVNSDEEQDQDYVLASQVQPDDYSWAVPSEGPPIGERQLNLPNLAFDVSLKGKFPPYMPVKSDKLKNAFVGCIAGMRNYRRFSVDELRIAYYEKLKQTNQSMAEVRHLREEVSGELSMAEKLPTRRVIEAIMDIAPKCTECLQPKMQICIEKCCTHNSLLCGDCQKPNHFLHRTNNLAMLFVNRKQIGNFTERLKASAADIQKCLEKQINSCMKVVQVQLQIVEALKGYLKQLEWVNVVEESYWHDEAYQTVGAYLQHKIKEDEASQRLEKALKKLNLHSNISDIWPNHSRTMQSYAHVESIMNAWSTHKQKFMKEIKALTVEGIQIRTVQELTRATPHQHYLDFSKIPVPSGLLQIELRSLKLCSKDDWLSEPAERLMCSSPAYYYGELSEETTELTCDQLPEKFPPRLMSLRLTFNQEEVTSADLNLAILPSSLVRFSLKISHDRLLKFDLGQLERLTKLKCLSINGGYFLLERQDQRCLLQLAIRNDMRLLRLKDSGTTIERTLNERASKHMNRLSQVQLMHRSKHVMSKGRWLQLAILETIEPFQQGATGGSRQAGRTNTRS